MKINSITRSSIVASLLLFSSTAVQAVQSNLEVNVKQQVSWDGGFCSNVYVYNPTDSKVLWDITFNAEGKITKLWNANYEQNGSTLQATASGLDWNNYVQPHENVKFGYCAKSVVVAPVAPTSPSDLQVTQTATATWDGGFCNKVVVKNMTQHAIDWDVNIDVNGLVYEAWNTQYTQDTTSFKMQAEGVNWNNIIQANGSRSFGYCAKIATKPLPPVETNTTTVAPTDPSAFNTVIDDNFDAADSSVWMQSDWANGSPFYSAWLPEQLNFATGQLTIKLEQKASHGLTHSAGEYRTLNRYKYGRYTSSFKASNIEGTVSSFFTYTGASEGTEWDEIDFEILGKDSTKVQVNYWRNGKEHPTIIDLGFDASKALHTYSFVWKADSIQWFVDGTLIHTEEENGLNDNDSLPVNAGKIMLNLWASEPSSWAGTYTDGTKANAVYDFVKFEELVQ
jgi:beta-glucanase (GH16 family)